MTTYMQQLKSDILKVAKEKAGYYASDNSEESLDDFNDWLLDDGEQVTWNYDPYLGKEDSCYYNDEELSKKQVFSDFSTVTDVLDGLLDDGLVDECAIINNLVTEDWDWFDVLTRRYLADNAFDEVKDEIKEIFENAKN